MKNLIILAFFLWQPPQKPVLIINIGGFENNRGKLMLKIENAQKKTVFEAIEPIEQKRVKLVVKTLPAGKYRVSVFHDENGNNQMDKNFIGYPTEKWALSNNIKAVFGPPNFEKAFFELNSSKEIMITLN